MKKTVLSFVASLALVSTLSASDKVYATVNGDSITNLDIAQAIRDPRVNFEKLPKNVKDKLIQDLINKKLVTQEAYTKKSVINSKDYKQALERIKKDLAFEVWQKQELESIKITDKNTKEFYNKNKNMFKTQATLSARHILVKELKDAEKIIKELDKAKDKEKEFIKLAKTKSVGPSGKTGGDLGTFPENQMVPEFSKAAKVLEKGAYSKKPVKTQYGYHVIYLKDKKAAKVLPYAEVKKNISQIMLGDAYGKKIKDLSSNLRKKAKIVIK